MLDYLCDLPVPAYAYARLYLVRDLTSEYIPSLHVLAGDMCVHAEDSQVQSFLKGWCGVLGEAAPCVHRGHGTAGHRVLLQPQQVLASFLADMLLLMLHHDCVT